MESQSAKNIFLESNETNLIDNRLRPFSEKNMSIAFEKKDEFMNLFQQNGRPDLDNLVSRLAGLLCKKNFLVFNHNKYFTVPTEHIAFFFVRNELTRIKCFGGNEYSVDYSLEQLQAQLTESQFFRLNRQYLINFSAVKEVEHYFARKLLVRLVVSVEERLLVSKEKASSFLHWLDNR